MKRLKYLVILCCHFYLQNAYGQQLPHSTFIENVKNYWNPAATATGETMNTDAFIRQQWLGFGTQAPRTTFLNFQYPFIDQHMSAGLTLDNDKTGPLAKTGVHLSYAYKIQGLNGRGSQLSLGMSAGFSQYRLDLSNQKYHDENDPLFAGSGSTSAMFPSIGFGLYYLSNTRAYDENAIFIGFGLRNAFTTNVLIENRNQARESHIHFNIGTRIYGYDSMFEPSITFNYSNPGFLDFRLGARYEVRESFWAGLGYSTNGEVNVQGGVIIPQCMNRYGTLRIGALASSYFGKNGGQFGPGLEIYVGYAYELK